tara:strand:- start:16764 stop:17120 length:357 start_codon:yes stop_codon:yes gene_type:complete
MSVKSAKAKGRRLQNLLRDILRETFPQLEEDDIKSQTMGMSGEDIVLSPAARKIIKYSFECKNKERLDLWKSLEQAEENSLDRDPVLVVKRNRSKIYAVIELNTFISLLKGTNHNDFK